MSTAVDVTELKPGERKIVADGAEGPVVEIIKRTTSATEQDTENAKIPEDSESQEHKGTTETGE